MSVTYVTTKEHRMVVVTHKKSKHDGMWYDCDHCDYQAAQQSGLAIHNKIKKLWHEV